tara:strand:+ start:590 stop:781 length:192 start_codon:yes stop_codon:yes gene_type:complete
MTDPEPVKSTSPDAFLRRKAMKGEDAATKDVGDKPLKSQGDLDTLYQPKESTTRNTDTNLNTQ